MKTKTIGILGDGQLARMSAQAAKTLGHSMYFYGTNPDGPCEGMGEFTQGNWDDLNAMTEFAKKVEIVTLENEFISSELLEALEKNGTTVYPTSATFKQIENKWVEKETFTRLGVPTPAYALIKDVDKDIEAFAAKYDFPIMLKSSKGGYDGYGNFLAKNLESAKAGFEKLGGAKGFDILMEQTIDFEREVAVTVVRNPKGDMAVYPVCDTLQENNICKLVASPSTVEPHVANEVQEYAKKVMQGIDAVGVFSFEFFVTRDEKVLINESAPRPHNSAHYTMDACVTSQFANHMLAVTNSRLGDTTMKIPRAVMLNLLGTQDGEPRMEGVKEFSSAKDVHFHFYGKKQNRVGRKMGHVNIVGRSREQLIMLAKYIQSRVRI